MQPKTDYQNPFPFDPPPNVTARVVAGDSPAMVLRSLCDQIAIPPQPPILPRRRNQSRANWILQNVLNLLPQTLVSTKNVIERLVLPNSA